MYPRYHVLATLIAALPLRAAGWRTGDLIAFGAGSILIDGDHYLAYVWQSGDLSFRRAYRFHLNRVQRDAARRGFNLHLPRIWPGRNRPLHALAVLCAVAAVAGVIPWLRPLAAGLLFHRLQDYIWESSRLGPGEER